MTKKSSRKRGASTGVASPAGGSAFGVRVRHHDKGWTRNLYYWNGGGLSLESRNARGEAVIFRSIRAAIRAGNGVRRWLKDCKIEYQVCCLPSWRVVKRSMPNQLLSKPAQVPCERMEKQK